MNPSDVATSILFICFLSQFYIFFFTIVSNKKLKTIILWNIN